jgi:hypothetical protein
MEHEWTREKINKLYEIIRAHHFKEFIELAHRPGRCDFALDPSIREWNKHLKSFGIQPIDGYAHHDFPAHVRLQDPARTSGSRRLVIPIEVAERILILGM